MTLLQLTSSQYLSSTLLSDLARIPDLKFSLLEHFNVQTNQQLPQFEDTGIDKSVGGHFEAMKTDKQLVVIGQSLNFEKLWDVQSRLQPHLDFCHWQFPKRYDGYGQLTARAEVNLDTGDELIQYIEEVCAALNIEIALLAERPALDKPGLLLMDMDSTVIDIECIDEIAKLAGVGKQVSEVTELAMQGKLDFSESLRSRVACLKGADEKVLKQVRDGIPLMPGIQNLLTTLREKGWKLAIASGGFTYFADYLAQRLQLDEAVSNQLKIVDQKLTGEVDGKIIDAQAKADTLISLAEQFGIPKEQTIALGDGANDLVMMEAAAFGVAFHAKPIVREQADAAIRFGGADTLLHFLV